MALKKDLPKIVKEALKEEDKTTRTLVDFLIYAVASEHSEKQIKEGLFDEIEKLYSSGMIEILEEEK